MTEWVIDPTRMSYGACSSIIVHLVLILRDSGAVIAGRPLGRVHAHREGTTP